MSKLVIIGAYGEIIRVVTCPDSMDANQAAEGETAQAWVQGVGFGTHYYDDGDFHEIPAAPGQYYFWDWPTHAWIISATALADAKAKQSGIVSAACKAQIVGGFLSSALGAAHHYPAKSNDQQNLSASVLSSLLPGLPPDWVTPFWCADSADVWAFRLHTAAEIQQVGTDAKAAILAAMGKNEVLQALVAAASTIEQAQAVVWD